MTGWGRSWPTRWASQETTLFKMVAAYAMFANGGERVEPTLVDRVQDRWGKTIYRHDQRICEDCADADPAARGGRPDHSNRERVMDAITAYQLTSMLEGVVQRGSASRLNLPVPIAGKTGTTNDAKDVWFIGFSSNIVAGCYIGYDQPRSLGASAFGGTLCVPGLPGLHGRRDQEVRRRPLRGSAGRPLHQDRPLHRRSSCPTTRPATMSWPNTSATAKSRSSALVRWSTVAFAMGENLPLFAYGEGDGGGASTTVTNSDGETVVVPKKADFGTVSSGGLY